MGKHLLFVYGTLRQGGVNAMPVLYPDSRFVGSTSIRGRLFDMGGYPAIVLENSGIPVAGEVYEIDDKTLTALDLFEASADYKRDRVEVVLNGEAIPCWIFGPEPAICSGKNQIESSDWIEFSKIKTDSPDLA